MKRALLSATAFVLVAAALQAQSVPSITGTWQGTLTYPNSPAANRLAFIIRKNPDGSLHRGLKYAQSDFGLAFSSITFRAPNLDLTTDTTGIAFHGQLTTDGSSITGTLTQGMQSFPLTLSRATPETLWTKPAGPPAMAADADPSFEVATIKPCDNVPYGVSYNLTGHPFTAKSVSATELIKIAWNIRGRQVIGGPSWINQNAYEITAIPDTPGLPSDAQGRAMVRKLLVERFHLVAHEDEREFPVMALSLDPKGPAPTPSDPDFNGHGARFQRIEGGDVIYQFSGVSIAQLLAPIMTDFQDKQLVDETGLTGLYDITLRMPQSVLQSPRNGGPDDERGAAWIAALQKAGFKFVSKKAPIPVVIVDHIDPPTPN